MPSESIAFMTDVDISLPVDVLDRVTRYVKAGQRVFNPIVFYECTEGGSEKCWEEGWGDGGPGVIALYAADATSFGGYDVKTYGELHGFEDTDFLLRVRSAGLSVVRQREAGIIHRAHPKAQWRLDREQKFGASFEAYWAVLSKQCSLELTELEDESEDWAAQERLDGDGRITEGLDTEQDAERDDEDDGRFEVNGNQDDGFEETEGDNADEADKSDEADDSEAAALAAFKNGEAGGVGLSKDDAAEVATLLKDVVKDNHRPEDVNADGPIPADGDFGRLDKGPGDEADEADNADGGAEDVVKGNHLPGDDDDDGPIPGDGDDGDEADDADAGAGLPDQDAYVDKEGDFEGEDAATSDEDAAEDAKRDAERDAKENADAKEKPTVFA